ncbi:MAG: 4-alpha-glucanotransferase [Puniceicoccales bacterium]|jgi:4-alpha-glucanotransferase|nr:4-alpha-glucanotransferase [Puniceicoccales bacterium]
MNEMIHSAEERAPNYLSPRCSGILLPVASLPGPYGIGELGQTALDWLDFLCDCGQKIWQILPLNPIGYGHSPYQSVASLACEPLLISLEELHRDGLLLGKELPTPSFGNHIAYGAIEKKRMELLKRAAERFLTDGCGADFTEFCWREVGWLEDHALFQVLWKYFQYKPWVDWPEPLRKRDKGALGRMREQFSGELAVQRVLQYFFHRHWEAIRQRARELGIKIVGDLPIFVSSDGADVWAHGELFDLNPDGRPRVVAGVPPDYFSATGQRWGNPLYRWEIHEREDYAWWVTRLRRAMGLHDVLRVDHFRGFADYWEIPAEKPTAVEGRWVRGPGKEFFVAAGRQLGTLPLIAEDLGILSDDAVELRKSLVLPGLRILLFAFDDYCEKSPFLPENFGENCVAYTGTHDNDTVLGTFFDGPNGTEEERQMRAKRRSILEKILPEPYQSLPLGQALLAWLANSEAQWVIFPMQDVLQLDGNARTNVPGKASGNWEWKLDGKSLGSVDRNFLRRLRP